MEANGYVKGLIIGGVIGLVGGLLYAPKKGKEIREDIQKSVTDLVEKAKGQYDLTKGKVENLVAREKVSLAEKKGRLKEAIEAGVEAFKEERSSSSPQA